MEGDEMQELGTNGAAAAFDGKGIRESFRRRRHLGLPELNRI